MLALALAGAGRAQTHLEAFKALPLKDAPAIRAIDAGAPIVRRRMVELNSEAFALDGSSGPSINLNLFADTSYVVKQSAPVSRLRSGNRLWVARGVDSSEAYAVFVLGDHGLRGSVFDGAGRYFKVIPSSDGAHELREVTEGFVDDRDDMEIPVAPDKALDAPLAKIAADAAVAGQSSPVFVDILVAYSPAARQQIGGAAAMRALADATFAEMNVGLAASQINARVRVAAAVEVAVPAGEAASSSFLNAVTGLPALEALRNQYGADMVTVWINGPASGGGIVGRAWIMQNVGPSFAPSAYSVLEVNWVDGPSFSFAHEAGHNLGAAHDRNNASVQGAYPYAYGHQSSGNFFTVMAYSNGCGSCSGINQWSNPNVLYAGSPTGVASGPSAADNARALNLTTPVAANWRAEVAAAAVPMGTGVFRPTNGALYLKTQNQTGFADVSMTYGLPGDKPVAGDWNGDNVDSIGVFRNGTFLLRNSNSNGFADVSFAYGAASGLPVVGDWDGDGVDTVGVFLDGAFALRNSNSSGAPHYVFSLGIAGDLPIAGDWDGDGVDTVGVFRPSTGALFLKNANSTGFADVVLTYGIPGDLPVTGDWDADGIDTIGVFRNGLFLLRNSNTNGFADISFGLGVSGDRPIAGYWGSL